MTSCRFLSFHDGADPNTVAMIEYEEPPGMRLFRIAQCAPALQVCEVRGLYPHDGRVKGANRINPVSPHPNGYVSMQFTRYDKTGYVLRRTAKEQRK